MMKFNTLLILITLSATITVSQMSFAETEQPTAEEIKLQKDKVKYKAYIPTKYNLFEAIEGDLNKDGVNDLVLIVKATDPSQWVDHEYRGKLDRNRRGIIVLLNQKGTYKKVVQNLTCFSSENEEGGVYYAPELWINIEKNVLHVHYGHGRYGFWDYAFRLEAEDLRLIGYDDSSNHGPYVESETSMNFLTGKKLVRDKINKDPEGDPVFKELWSKFNRAPMYLTEIKDFDELILP